MPYSFLLYPGVLNEGMQTIGAKIRKIFMNNKFLASKFCRSVEIFLLNWDL